MSDKYAHLAPGAGNRGCRRSDGGPKRRYTDGDAHVAADAINDQPSADVHAYRCDGECGVDVWHVGRLPAKATP